MRVSVLILVALIFNSLTAMSQENSDVAISQSKSELLAGKSKGVFVFVLPESLTAEEVQKNSRYYVHNFTVDFNEGKREAKITMLTNDARGRQVVIRFLTACGIRHVTIDGVLMESQDFYNKFLKDN